MIYRLFSFAQWPVSEVHRDPVYQLIEGCQRILDALGLQSSEAQIMQLLEKFPVCERSQTVKHQTMLYFKALQQQEGKSS